MLSNIDKAIEVAKKAFLKNADNQFIADITGLSLKQVQELRNNTQANPD